MKLILAHICYFLGDMISKLLYLDILVDVIYPVYNKLMQWSAELDTNNVIWHNPKESDEN
jgi:hypothetical protein|tara:strand:- start:836 stop:1015 length:180 start_codon:yes stop_codon:yes gene_type:complete